MTKSRPRVCVVLPSVVFALCSTVPLLAQGFGTISGTITDPSGAALAQGTIVASEVATGLSRSSVAGQDGYYVLNSLRPAEYILTVEQSGFEKFRRTGVVLLANQSLTVNITMALGSTNE